MVDRPFLSMILSAADPEPASSSLSELSAKVKMVLHIYRLINGLFAWDVSLQLSSRMSGSPPSNASMISVVRSRLIFLGSSWCEQRLARRHVHTDELLVLLVKDPMPMFFGVARSSFVSDDLDAQTVSLLEISPEGNLMLLSSS